MEGQHVAVAAVGLVPNGVAGGQRNGAGIAESTNTAKAAEVVIEGAVFLHHEDDVLHVINGAGAIVGRDAECPRDAGGESCGDGGGA